MSAGKAFSERVHALQEMHTKSQIGMSAVNMVVEGVNRVLHYAIDSFSSYGLNASSKKVGGCSPSQEEMDATITFRLFTRSNPTVPHVIRSHRMDTIANAPL